MDWTQLDWQALDRLRDGFIKGTAANGPYWRTLSDLENYDFTYAERIGWKWDAVLSELRRRAWKIPVASRTLLDWGCGSGIASRRVLRAFGAENFATLVCWDHSQLARDFSAARARHDYPNLRVDTQEGIPSSAFTLVLSHVINELSEDIRAQLLALARAAAAIIWVEPGTHADSHALVAIREMLRPDFDIVAPCTHAAGCGLLTPGNERHWCHNFAEPPPNIFADSNWVKFGQRAGIDLRGLPYSFLVLEKKRPHLAETPSAPPSKAAHNASRIIGRARFHKAHAAICNCDVNGVSELIFYKRSDPALFKKLDRAPNYGPKATLLLKLRYRQRHTYFTGKSVAVPDQVGGGIPWVFAP